MRMYVRCKINRHIRFNILCFGFSISITIGVNHFQPFASIVATKIIHGNGRYFPSKPKRNLSSVVCVSHYKMFLNDVTL